MFNRLLKFTIASCLAVLPALAQGTTGAIEATVTDSSGSVIPGAAVTAVNQETGSELQAQTDQLGVCQFPVLRPGHYRLVAESTGFQKLQRDDVTVNATETVHLDLRLVVGAVSETMTVTGDPRYCKASRRRWGMWSRSARSLHSAGQPKLHANSGYFGGRGGRDLQCG